MTVKLLTEHHLEFLNLTGDCTGSSESTLVKMPHCLKSHVMAHMSKAKTFNNQMYPSKMLTIQSRKEALTTGH